MPLLLAKCAHPALFCFSSLASSEPAEETMLELVRAEFNNMVTPNCRSPKILLASTYGLCPPQRARGKRRRQVT